MRIGIAAVGRLKAGPERDILDRYLKRSEALGRRLGFTFAVHESAESRAPDAPSRKEQEGAALLARLAPDAPTIALDEHGRSLASTAFADLLAAWRDGGRREAVFLIGGADGLSDALLARADMRLAFGTMTWPHQLVRIMLAEQIYRALTVLAGHPYHRA